MVARFDRLCRSQGAARTIQRRTVYETLLDSDNHPTVDEIYRRTSLRTPGISPATVYRILEWLESVRLVTRIKHPGSASHYEVTTVSHDHIYCLKCQRVVDVDAPPTPVRPPAEEDARGFDIVGHSLIFEGLCPDCRKEGEDKS